MTTQDLAFPIHSAVLVFACALVAAIALAVIACRIIEGRFPVAAVLVLVLASGGTWTLANQTSAQLNAELAAYAKAQWGLSMSEESAALVRKSLDQGQVTVRALHSTGPVSVTFVADGGAVQAYMAR